MRCCSFWMNWRRSCLSLSVSLSRSAWSIVEESMASSVAAVLAAACCVFASHGEEGEEALLRSLGLMKMSDAQNLYLSFALSNRVLPA